MGPKNEKPKFVDKSETVFAQLERMGSETVVRELHKAPLLLASMGSDYMLESTAKLLKSKETEQLSWETVTADLIQEWSTLCASKYDRKPKTKNKTNLKTVLVTETLVELTEVLNLAVVQVIANFSLCVIFVDSKVIEHKNIFHIPNHLAVNYRFVLKNQSRQCKSNLRTVLKTAIIHQILPSWRSGSRKALPSSEPLHELP